LQQFIGDSLIQKPFGTVYYINHLIAEST